MKYSKIFYLMMIIGVLLISFLYSIYNPRCEQNFKYVYNHIRSIILLEFYLNAICKSILNNIM